MPPSIQDREVLGKLWNDKQIVVCSKHYYSGAPKQKPVDNCKECWLVYWVNIFKGIPEADRQEWLAKMYETLRYMNEHVEKGTWDYTPFRHPQIQIQRDVPQEMIEQEKKKGLEDK